MKKFVLDVSKWRCGGGTTSGVRLGKGDTALLNEFGYMCCLGQFCKQEGLPEIDLIEIGEPYELEKEVPLLTLLNEDGYINSAFSKKAMDINDDECTTVLQKINQLRELFATVDIELEVVNIPDSITPVNK
jgi:hypothetical protein